MAVGCGHLRRRSSPWFPGRSLFLWTSPPVCFGRLRLRQVFCIRLLPAGIILPCRLSRHRKSPWGGQDPRTYSRGT
ncbi:hypothetical protein NDU88_004754 [Pleurodeles waltl]|uniref:Uncharacterized protein n=1 Tax=Pleurodeles waltl TaxID=8319 RepID=A0AAV7LMP5_PLEWA|nr:hypothetical protein NDU88_004754 [Pleurodeles waltl]